MIGIGSDASLWTVGVIDAVVGSLCDKLNSNVRFLVGREKVGYVNKPFPFPKSRTVSISCLSPCILAGKILRLPAVPCPLHSGCAVPITPARVTVPSSGLPGGGFGASQSTVTGPGPRSCPPSQAPTRLRPSQRRARVTAAQARRRRLNTLFSSARELLE